MTNEVNEMSAGSRGSQEPVAWRAYDADGSKAVYSLYEQARTDADDMNWSVEPLYRKPMLEQDERAALLGLACYLDTRGSIQLQAWGSLLRVLLARFSGERQRSAAPSAASRGYAT